MSAKHNISLRKATRLLSISRSSLYYKAKGEKEENIKLMELIDRKYTEDPTFGVRRMRNHLRRLTEKRISIKRTRRLMRKMGLQAVYSKPKTSQRAATRCRNLLNGVKISKPNQVWFADITYVRVKGGFGYCVAFVDGFSRKIMAMKLSNSLTADFCVEAAREAVEKYGSPEIVHTDKGKQFVGKEFTEFFRSLGTKLSVSEEGFKGNIRLIRTYKHECLYLWEELSLKEAKEVTGQFKDYYNRERPHQALGYKTPDEVYYGHSCCTVV